LSIDAINADSAGAVPGRSACCCTAAVTVLRGSTVTLTPLPRLASTCCASEDTWWKVFTWLPVTAPFNA
jgi:hypothetical protein